MAGVSGGRSYLMIDERAAGGKLREMHTLTCKHCNCVVVLNPERKRDRHTCRKCMAYVCDKPACILECTPIPELMDLAIKYPTQPWLERGPNGEQFFNPALREQHKIY